MRELRHDRNEREQRDPGRKHRQTELRVAVQLPRLGSDVAPQAVLSLRLRPGDDACVSSTSSPSTRLLDGVEAGRSLPSVAPAVGARSRFKRCKH